MSNLPLQPLVWDWSYGDGDKTSALCRAKSLSHEYIIRLEQCGYCYVDYRKFDNDESGNNRKDEAPEFNSVKEAQYWVDNTHYPHTMQPYVKPSPTWIDYEIQKPKDGDNIVITWLWMGDRHTVHLNDYSAKKSNYLDGCPEVYWSLSPFISTMQNLHKGE